MSIISRHYFDFVNLLSFGKFYSLQRKLAEIDEELNEERLWRYEESMRHYYEDDANAAITSE